MWDLPAVEPHSSSGANALLYSALKIQQRERSQERKLAVINELVLTEATKLTTIDLNSGYSQFSIYGALLALHEVRSWVEAGKSSVSRGESLAPLSPAFR